VQRRQQSNRGQTLLQIKPALNRTSSAVTFIIKSGSGDNKAKQSKAVLGQPREGDPMGNAARIAAHRWRRDTGAHQLLTDLGIGAGSGGPDLTDPGTLQPGTRTQGPRTYRRRGKRTRARDGTEKRDAWQLPPSSEVGCCCGGERGARLGADSGEEA